MKNLFEYATKELSQDAFLRWLIENWNESDDKELQKASRGFLNSLTDNAYSHLDYEKAKIVTYAQVAHMDITIDVFPDKDKKLSRIAKGSFLIDGAVTSVFLQTVLVVVLALVTKLGPWWQVGNALLGFGVIAFCAFVGIVRLIMSSRQVKIIKYIILLFFVQRNNCSSLLS